LNTEYRLLNTGRRFAMPKPTEFLTHLLDLLSPLGNVRAKSMFGGWGIYHDSRMFALVAYETFYVKVDDLNRPDFLAANLAPFSYETKNGRREVMSYHTVPAEALDSSPLLCDWARKGLEAATRAAQSLKPKKRLSKKNSKS
jgi:DNA transformation protein and related proteins